MTEKRGIGDGAGDDLRRPLEEHAARVEGGRLRVDSPTRLPDGTEVPLDVSFDVVELTPEQHEAVRRYEGRPYSGTVRNGHLRVDEPTALPDGIGVSVFEDWPLPPEEQARLEEALAESQRDYEAGRCIEADDVFEKTRIARALTPAERDKFEAEYNAELERRFAQGVPGGCVTMRDFLARWRKSR